MAKNKRIKNILRGSTLLATIKSEFPKRESKDLINELYSLIEIASSVEHSKNPIVVELKNEHYIDNHQLTTYRELQEDKQKLGSDIKKLCDEFKRVHGDFIIKISTISYVNAEEKIIIGLSEA